MQGVMTPSPSHLPWAPGRPRVWGLSVPGAGPGACPLSAFQETEEEGGIILFKVHFLIYKCSRGMWAPSLQWVSEGPGHMSMNHVARRGSGDSGKDHPTQVRSHPAAWGGGAFPQSPSTVRWGLPARPRSCLHPSTRQGVGGVCVEGCGQGSLPIPAAQLPAVLILAALRVVHLVDTETLLEVLGPDLGVQDLLGHIAGEPASLLVMQTLAKDPAWEGGETAGHKLSPSGLGWASLR